MNEILKELDTALKLISTLRVSGDAVDVVAVAKSSLRKVRADVETLQAGNAAAPERGDHHG